MLTAKTSVDKTDTRTAIGRRYRARAAAGATVAALAVGLLTRALDVELVVDMGGAREPMEIGLPLIGGFALAVSLAGWGGLAALERWTFRARRLWTGLATGVFALSLIPVVGAEASGDVKLTLAAIHVVVAAVLIVGMRRSVSAAAGKRGSDRSGAALA